jgi:Na+/H+ antiporter NhaA
MIPVFRRFVKWEAATGILLVVCALIALSGANSPWGGSYAAWWETKLALGFVPLHLDNSLLHWINEGLMESFFLLATLANVDDLGAVLDREVLFAIGQPVSLGILVGLILGKPLGTPLLDWLAVRSGFAVLPPGISWRHMIGIGLLAGIGFTMSLFIASLAFTNGPELATAKMAILIASILSGLGGYLLLLTAGSRRTAITL